VLRSAILITLSSVLGAGLALAQTGPAPADALVIQVKDRAELHDKFCAANPNIEHVLIAPASLFVDSQQMICSGGPYKLYRIVEATDTDDFEYYLDPPIYAKGNRLGCDGKAGLAMQSVALNCRPLASPK
jgi:hypothetical protein